MLVLQRKRGEVIVIGDSIRVRVLGIHANHVRLGFSAPDEVSIFREECLPVEALAEETAPARQPAPSSPE